MEHSICRENRSIVSLDFGASRPVARRGGQWIRVDEARLVRFRDPGCDPLTGAVESSVVSVPAIRVELRQGRTSERQGRTVDCDEAGSMEKRKQEGRF